MSNQAISLKTIQKPEVGEYAPYTSVYIDLVPNDGLILQHLLDNVQIVKKLLITLPEDKLITPCTEGEWTIKEIVGHLSDAERILTYRTLRFARNDSTELPGFDQDTYVAASGANARSIEDLLDELTAVRMTTVALFSSFEAATWHKSGRANGYPLSVRAAAYMIAGHELHHLESIKENYLTVQ
jgi:DinB family protein